MALFKIPAMLRMSLRYVNTLQVFNGFLCPLLALLTDWDVPPIRNTRRIIALLMFLNGFALERKYLTRSQNCSRAHTTGIYVLMDSPSINVREREKKTAQYLISKQHQKTTSTDGSTNMPTLAQVFDWQQVSKQTP